MCFRFFFIDLCSILDESQDTPKQCIKIYGKTFDNLPFSLNVSDFHPYFYVENNSDSLQIINSDISQLISSVSAVSKKEYYGGTPVSLLKITTMCVKDAERLIRIFKSKNIKLYEYDIPFTKRFLIDCHLYPFRITELQSISSLITKNNKTWHANVSYKDLRSLPPGSSDKLYTPLFLSIRINPGVNSLKKVQPEIADSLDIQSISMCYGRSRDESYSFSFNREQLSMTEKELLLIFLQKVHSIQPDVFITFDGNFFDFPLLIRRCEVLGIDALQYLSYFPSNLALGLTITPKKTNNVWHIPGKLHIDISRKFRYMHPPSGRSYFRDFVEMYTRENPRKSFFSLLNDEGSSKYSPSSIYESEMVYFLFWEIGAFTSISAISPSGLPAHECLNTTSRNIGEFLLFRICFGQDVLIPALPSKVERRERRRLKKENPHKGGLVFEPEKSLYENVIIADFLSMYPTIIIAYNIGGESLQYNSKQELQFDSSPDTSLSIMMKSLLEKRVSLKKEYSIALNSSSASSSYLHGIESQQLSLKLILNSVYGSHNYPSGRFFSTAISNFITKIGRFHLREMKEKAPHINKDLSVIYGDTDSIFISIGRNLIPQIKLCFTSPDSQERESLLNTITKKSHRLLEQFKSLLPESMSLQLEDIAYRVAFKPEKRKAYAYSSTSHRELIIRGFEAVRSDWCPLAKSVQKSVLHYLLFVDSENLKNEANLVLQTTINSAFELPFRSLLPKVTVFSPIRRDPLRYRVQSPVLGAYSHYCRSKGLDEREEWKNFDRFPWVITKGVGPLYKRSRHPLLAKSIDTKYYYKLITNIVQQFGVSPPSPLPKSAKVTKNLMNFRKNSVKPDSNDIDPIL